MPCEVFISCDYVPCEVPCEVFITCDYVPRPARNAVTNARQCQVVKAAQGHTLLTLLKHPSYRISLHPGPILQPYRHWICKVTESKQGAVGEEHTHPFPGLPDDWHHNPAHRCT